MKFARVVTAVSAVMLVATVAEAQFSSVGGFRVKSDFNGNNVYGGVSSDLGVTRSVDLRSTIAPSPSQFNLFYTASTGTLAFSWGGLSIAQQSFSGLPSFNAIQFNVRGSNNNGGVSLADVTFNGNALLANFSSGATNSFSAFSGVNSDADFTIVGMMEFLAPITGREGQRFEFNVGDAGNNPLPSIPGTSVPEPTSLALLGLGLAGVLASRRRRETV